MDLLIPSDTISNCLVPDFVTPKGINPTVAESLLKRFFSLYLAIKTNVWHDFRVYWASLSTDVHSLCLTSALMAGRFRFLSDQTSLHWLLSPLTFLTIIQHIHLYVLIWRVDLIIDGLMTCLLYFYAIWTNKWAHFEKRQMLNLVSLKHVKPQKRVLLSGRSVHTLLHKRSQHHMGYKSTSVIQLNPAILRLIIVIIIIMKGYQLMFLLNTE